MQIERKANGIMLVPESEWEQEALIELRKRAIKGMEFQNSWEQTGKLIIEFETGWGR